ncbi:MAG: hypothetical protein V1898_00995 [Patescibacteria group bacterium]
MPIKNKKKLDLKLEKVKPKKAKQKPISLDHKIIFIFTAITISILMSGFIVQAQLMTEGYCYYKSAANYYYDLSTGSLDSDSTNNQNINSTD